MATSSRIMHHVTKLKSSQTGFLNMTMSSLYSNDLHSHQISVQYSNHFIVTSPQHMCLGEWNSWARAPDSRQIIQIIQMTMCNIPVVDKVHRSSTWVKVQIRIIKYYSSKSKSTAFSILLEWKYKSTQFFMYLSKKVLIDRFILQFYIDYFI